MLRQRLSTTFLISLLASFGAIGLSHMLNENWQKIICYVIASLGIPIAIIDILRFPVKQKILLWIGEKIGESSLVVVELPWDKIAKKAASSDGEEALSAFRQALELIEKNPDFCEPMLSAFHGIARPDLHSSQEVRESYAGFRVVAFRIIIETQAWFVGTICSSLSYLLESRHDDVRRSATTELGLLCDRAEEPEFPQTWRNFCFDLLETNLKKYIDRKDTYAQTLIRHASATIHQPDRFRRIFGELIGSVVQGREEPIPEYNGAICDLLCEISPEIVKICRYEDLQLLQHCEVFCTQRSLLANKKKELRIFEKWNNDRHQNNRPYRRLHLGKEISSIEIKCQRGIEGSCSACPCRGSDISIIGTNSGQCEVDKDAEIRNLQITLYIDGTQERISIRRALVVRRYTDNTGTVIPGAGLAFVDWGKGSQELMSVLTKL